MGVHQFWTEEYRCHACFNQEINSLLKQDVSIEHISSRLSPWAAALYDFLPIFIKKQVAKGSTFLLIILKNLVAWGRASLSCAPSMMSVCQKTAPVTNLLDGGAAAVGS